MCLPHSQYIVNILWFFFFTKQCCNISFFEYLSIFTSQQIRDHEKDSIPAVVKAATIAVRVITWKPWVLSSSDEWMCLVHVCVWSMTVVQFKLWYVNRHLIINVQSWMFESYLYWKLFFKKKKNIEKWNTPREKVSCYLLNTCLLYNFKSYGFILFYSINSIYLSGAYLIFVSIKLFIHYVFLLYKWGSFESQKLIF